VKFVGYVKKEEKERLIRESNAFVFPSLLEGFGLVILEAFEQKVPVIVSDLRPMSDIVTHNETGYVLDPKNENQWADYLLKLVKNKGESERMGKNGNAILKNNYNPDFMYQKIIEMYENVCK